MFSGQLQLGHSTIRQKVFYPIANSYSIRKNRRKIGWYQVNREFRRYGLKSSSAETYEKALLRFCDYAEIEPDQFRDLGLECVEDLMIDFIADNRDKLAPKYLNVIFNAVKRWCYLKKLMKSTKMFRDIKFDKSSRKTDALTETMLETKHVKAGFKIANLEDQIDWGLFALCGLRPRIIPQLRPKSAEVITIVKSITKSSVYLSIQALDSTDAPTYCVNMLMGFWTESRRYSTMRTRRNF